MNKKEIITIIISLTVIGVAAYFTLQMLLPQTQYQQIERKSDTIPEIKTEVDDNTYRTVENLSDYGLPTLENIGKSNIFEEN